MGVRALPDSRRVTQQACTTPAGLKTCKLICTLRRDGRTYGRTDIASRLSGGGVRDNWRYLNKNKTVVQVGKKKRDGVGGCWSAAAFAV